MIAISLIVVVVMLISLYDYFSSKNWQQVTSETRNETVFNDRNRNYGAYVIRRDYNKQLAIIVGGVILGTGILYATARNEKIEAAAIKRSEVVVEYYLPTKEDKPAIELPENQPIQNTQPTAPTDRFVEPTPSDTDDQPVDIPDGTTNVGNHDQDGDSGFGGTLPISTNTNPGGPTIVETRTPEGPVSAPDEFAEYPGGRPAMVSFLQENLIYPEIAYELRISGKCHLRFVVDKSGEISQVQVERGVPDCPECDKEAVKAIKKMPKWRPGKVKGKAVDSYFRLPIKFEVK